MAALLAKLERPALTDIAAAWPAETVEMLPARVPDLYEGEPVVLVARVPGGLGDAPGALRLSGRRGEARWEHALPLAGGRGEEGIARLWGRARIADLMASLRLGADAAEVRREVLETALRFHLMSRYTSLVAVDTTPARPAGAAVLRRNVGLNLPEGWSYEKIFGDLLPPSQPPALPPRDAALQGDGAPVVPASVAPALRQAAPAGHSVPLPQGATPMALHAIAGSAALVLLVVVLAWRRRHG
jgi:Ca-activated chloride channel family protein